MKNVKWEMENVEPRRGKGFKGSVILS